MAQLVEQLSTLEEGEDAPRAEVYATGTVHASTTYQTMAQAIPQATYTIGADGFHVVAIATPKQHARLKEINEAIRSQTSSQKLQTYVLTEMTAAQAIAYVQNEIPGIRVNVGSKPSQLLVWTTEENHAKVKTLLERLDVAESEETRPTLKTYDLVGGQSSRFLQVLRSAVPGAQMSFGTDRRSMTVWASPKEHKILGELIEQIAQEKEGENAPRLQVYKTKGVPASTVYSTLAQALPEARYTVSADPYQLIVLATPNEHERIAKMVDVLCEQSSSVELKTYTLEVISPGQAISFITGEIPQARATPGPRTNQLLVWTTPENHVKVAELLEKLTKDPPEESAEAMKVYTLKGVTPQALLPILQQEFPSVRMAYGTKANQLLAWAAPAKHEDIAKFVAEMDQKESAETAEKIQVYTLDKTPISTAYQLFVAAAPTIRVGYGPTSQPVDCLGPTGGPQETGSVDGEPGQGGDGRRDGRVPARERHGESGDSRLDVDLSAHQVQRRRDGQPTGRRRQRRRTEAGQGRAR